MCVYDSSLMLKKYSFNIQNLLELVNVHYNVSVILFLIVAKIKIIQEELSVKLINANLGPLFI